MAINQRRSARIKVGNRLQESENRYLPSLCLQPYALRRVSPDSTVEKEMSYRNDETFARVVTAGRVHPLSWVHVGKAGKVDADIHQMQLISTTVREICHF